MRLVAYSALGVVLLILSGLVLLSALFNLCGVFHLQDCGDGPLWVNVSLTIGLGGLGVGAIWAAYRMFRRAFEKI